MPAPPLVSIAMPVYNGEQYVAQAIDSVLAQTFTDIELIISDDGSTDGTEDICREYAQKDVRARYYRAEHNLGLGKNFDYAYSLSRGRYFKWMAQDDIIKPTYLERCVAALESHSDVVLAHSLTMIQNSEDHAATADNLPISEQERASDRFSLIVLHRHWNFEIMGLMRRSALERTRLHQDYFGSDRALIAQLALLGRFVRIDEPLFVNRDHPDRVMRRFSFADRLWFHDPGRSGRRVLPQLTLYRDYWRSVGQAELRAGERLRCYAALLKWWLVNWNLARVGIDLVAAIAPRVSEIAFRARARYHVKGIGAR